MSLLDMTALELSRAILSRKCSAPEVLQEILARAETTEKTIHAYLDTDPDSAIREAKRIQARIDRGEAQSPLAGVPIALKDNICTDHLNTTCASRMLADYRPPYRATVVDRLTERDLIIHGKLNMDEFMDMVLFIMGVG